jgi:hypothetical protein
MRIVVWFLLTAAACGGSGAAAGTCSDATIQNDCAVVGQGPCKDSHGNTCIVCIGSHVSKNCIYDPQAPLDGGTAVCVSQCSDCGSACQAH